MASPATAAVFGSTGHSGQFILTTLLASDSIKTVYTFSRRAPKVESAKLSTYVDRDTSKWASSLLEIQPPPNAVFSALAVTHAEAGSMKNKWKIDHDLNIELAKAAKAAGAKTFVFISGAGARSMVGAYFADMQMKKGVEVAIETLGFDHVVVLRPGLILGQRETPHPIGPLLNTIVRGFGVISGGLQDRLGQEAEVVGRAAVRAAQLASEGKAPSKPWILDGPEIVKLGSIMKRG
ncbi:NAD dependent epimerase/dehydratase family protein [Thozetella sp. PMI_491]|nr:NAD dependent epimerase/dehydratase family protein [Thozetella sp. PMI_491]